MFLRDCIFIFVVLGFVWAQDNPFPTASQVFSHPACTQAEILEQLGYTYIPCFGRYKVHTKKTTWDDARKICENEGTHLVIIETQNEETVLLKLWNLVPTGGWVHVGVHQPGTHGQPWMTVKGDLLNTTASLKNDATKIPSQYALFLKRNEGGLHWDVKGYQAEFICEQELL